MIMGILFSYFSQVQQDQLKIQTELAAQGVSHEGEAYFEHLRTQDYRITWIDYDGSVIYDSQSNASDMENHMERQEIKQAMEYGYGESSRYSSTLTQRYLYSAKKLGDGTVIRLSVSQNTVLTLMLGMLQPSCIVIFIALILSLFLASRLSKSIVKPLNDINLDDPLSNEGYDELSPLLGRIESQQKQLKAQSHELKRKQNEFEAVTSNMNEGLVLLNNNGKILSINHSAKKLLSAGGECIGQDILTVNRTLELQGLLEKAINGSSGEIVMEFGGEEYQINSSPVMSGSKVSGAVILMFDVTEKEKSEQMRREFTSNVSHELKTPLHSISGYAELLNNGMVRQEDITRFAGKIYTESQRMIKLVEDIIGLSRLDEGAEEMKREDVDLYALSQETVQSLAKHAEEAHVTLSLSGTSTVINAVPQLIRGIIYNLCDNAIKYNRDGGSVDIEVGSDDSEALLKVSDTGIGIAPEHQNRIFERFYRVDKSHSKAVGGTGLGLSIVKHAALIHDAAIELESVVGEGTSITVRFPR